MQGLILCGKFGCGGQGSLRSVVIFSALAAAGCLFAGPAFPADWPMFRGNAARTGFASEQAYPPLTKVWEVEAGGGIVSSPVILGGVVYFGGQDGGIYAFAAASGAQVWRVQTGGRVDSTPAVSSAAVYAASLDGYLYSLNRLTGELLWRAGLGAPSVSSPLLLDGRVYVGSGDPDKKLRVFDANSGRALGELPAAQPVESAPSSDGTLVYFGANDGWLYAAGKASLLPVWSYRTMGGRYGIGAAAVSNGIVYALPGFDENKPLAFSASGGVLLNPSNLPFEAAALQPDGTVPWAQVGSPVVSPAALYFSGGFSGNKLHALAAVPAEQKLAYSWNYALGPVSGAGRTSSPVMANDVIYAGTAGGSLAAFSPAGDPVPLSADVNFSSPVYSSPGVSNGMIFVGTSGGRLAAYRAAKVSAISAPGSGEIVNGSITVRGYVSNPDLAGYTLEYSTGGAAVVWRNIVSSSTVFPVLNGELAVWDTSQVDKGPCTLRLTALENSAPAVDNASLLTFRVNPPPLAPAALTAADVPGDSGNRIVLAWPPSTSGAMAEYRIYRSSYGVFGLLGSVSGAANAYTDAAAVTGSTFTYTVRAYDGYLESGDSPQAFTFSVNNDPLSDLASPSAPAGLAASPGAGGGKVLLSWTASGDDGITGAAAGYTIRYSTSPGYDWTAFDGASLWKSSRAAAGPYGTPETETVSGLFGGVTYYFALKAYDDNANFSSVSQSATSWATVDTVVPGPPSELLVSDTLGDNGGSLTLKWTLSPDDGAGNDNVYGYKIFRRTQASAYISSAPYALVRGAAKFIDGAAPDSLRFYYRIAAFSSSRDSALSAEVSGVSADNWRFFDFLWGGTVQLPDGMSVMIPPEAASQNDSILVTRLDAATYQPLSRVKAAGQANPTGIVYEVKFSSSVTRLLKPALLTFPYTDAEVAGMNTENLRVYALEGGAWRMVNTSVPDAVNRRVSAEVLHFSIFSIMEYVPSGALLAAEEVYTYPNPSKGDVLTFKFRPTVKAGVEIEVYSVSGERVASLKKADCPANVASELAWNIKKLASGVYVYRLKVESASGSKTVIKKLAIIH